MNMTETNLASQYFNANWAKYQQKSGNLDVLVETNISAMMAFHKKI